MFRVSKLIAVVGGAALIAACGGSDANKSAPPAPAPGAKKVDESTAGSLSGKVTIEGTVPANQPIAMGSDPVCAGAHKDPVTAETFVVKGGGLDNVFVYIKDDLG